MSEKKKEEKIGEIVIKPSKIPLVDYNGDDINHTKPKKKVKKVKKKSMSFPTIKETISVLDSFVFQNESAKRVLAKSISDLEDRVKLSLIDVPNSNALIFGDTGTGKTLLAETLSKSMSVPFISMKMTGLSSSGYVGTSIEDYFESLIEYGSGRVFRDFSEYAVVYLDEIDKLAVEQENSAGFGPELQNELIGLLESSTVLKEYCNGLSTKNMFFIGTGAFVGLEDIVSKRLKEDDGGIGFTSKIKTNRVSRNKLLRQVIPEDLIKYGFKPELVGRFPSLCCTDSMNQNSLVSIMDMETSVLSRKIIQTSQGNLNTKVEITSDAKKLIAQYAIKQGTNARGIQAAVEKLFEPLYFEFSDKNEFLMDSKYVKKNLFIE